jgi:hypothetical protein
MKKTFIHVVFLLYTSVSFGQGNEVGIIGIDSKHSYKMLEPNQDLRKVSIFMDERGKGIFANKKLIVGASLISIFDLQKSNTDSKFGYLMRHPTPSNEIGEIVSEAALHSFQLSLSGSVNNWLGAYSELLYNPEQSFGQGTITALGRNQVQLRKGFVVVGDLNKFPIYGAIGKMDAPFGLTGSVNPFTNSTMWHAFGGLAYGAQVSLKRSGLHATFMAVQGGSQFRGLQTSVDSTNVPSRLNNFVGDISYTFDFDEKIEIKVGGSYMKGSSYCHVYPVQHFEPCKENNPAYTAYFNVDILDKVQIMGSFAKTVNLWPGTFNPAPPLDVFEASKVSSIDAGIKYTISSSEVVEYAVSGEFSNFVSGPDGAPWQRQNQVILGFSSLIQQSSKLFIELFRTDGYVPLNFISGGNQLPGTTHSLKDANSIGLVIGGQLTF